MKNAGLAPVCQQESGAECEAVMGQDGRYGRQDLDGDTRFREPESRLVDLRFPAHQEAEALLTYRRGSRVLTWSVGCMLADSFSSLRSHLERQRPGAVLVSVAVSPVDGASAQKPEWDEV